MRIRFMTWAGLAAVAMATAVNVRAADKITYEDSVLPIFRNHCLKCHNANDNKGGLDLTMFSGVLKGGGSGTGVVSGDPDGSKLFKAITHAEEPNMPPNAPKISEKDIDVIKLWIAGGLLEASGSKAIVASKPKIDLALAGPVVGKPEGPPPMPADLLLEPTVRTARASVSTGLASSPWAPLVALGGQKQVLLYNTDNLELAGVLSFPEGFPADLKFSRNGKFILAGGGYGAKLGLVVLWDVTTGERVVTVGDEFDTVLAADISGDQQWIALGGPSRLVKIFATEDGKLKHHIKKHTDWVTALEFSPNSKLLATGDRNGAIHVWETATGQELYVLKGHRAAITAFSWRADSETMVSSSEDGTIKLWKVKDEEQIRSWTAHRDGALWAACAHDGRVASCGRDGQFAVWDSGGSRRLAVRHTNDIPVRVTFTHDGKRLVGSDWAGNVWIWNAADGKKIGELPLNPPTLAEKLVQANERVKQLQGLVEKAEADLSTAEADVTKAEGAETNGRLVEAAKKKAAEVKAELEKHKLGLAWAELDIAEIKAAQFNVAVFHARDELTVRQRENAKLLQAAAEANQAVENATAKLRQARKASVTMKDTIDGLKNVLRFDQRFADEVSSALKQLQKGAAKLESQFNKAVAEAARAKADAANMPVQKRLVDAAQRKQKTADALRLAFEAAVKELSEKQAKADTKKKELEATRADLAKAQARAEELADRIKPLSVTLRKAEAETVGAKLAAEKSAKELAQAKSRVEELTAAYHRLKPVSVEARKSARL